MLFVKFVEKGVSKHQVSVGSFVSFGLWIHALIAHNEFEEVQKYKYLK